MKTFGNTLVLSVCILTACILPLNADNTNNPPNSYSEVKILAQKWQTTQEIETDFDDLLSSKNIKGQVDENSIKICQFYEKEKRKDANPIPYNYNRENKRLILEIAAEPDNEKALKTYRVYFNINGGNTSDKHSQTSKNILPKLLPNDASYIFSINSGLKGKSEKTESNVFPFEIPADYNTGFILLTALPGVYGNYSFRVLPSSYRFSIWVKGKALNTSDWNMRIIAGWWSEKEKKFLMPFSETTVKEVRGISEFDWTKFEKVFTPPLNTDYAYFIIFLNKSCKGGTMWLDKPDIAIIDLPRLDNLSYDGEEKNVK